MTDPGAGPRRVHMRPLRAHHREALHAFMRCTEGPWQVFYEASTWAGGIRYAGTVDTKAELAEFWRTIPVAEACWWHGYHAGADLVVDYCMRDVVTMQIKGPPTRLHRAAMRTAIALALQDDADNDAMVRECIAPLLEPE